jgi:predicted Fe-S protein YdhL (DUF1289 family)
MDSTEMQILSSKSRWGKLTKEQRSAVMSKVAKNPRKSRRKKTVDVA